MPYRFVYQINNTNHVFQCNINSVRCEANTRAGVQCSRLCAIGTPFCYSHLLSEKHLRIKESNNPNYGKGLFAQISRSAADHSVVFRNRSTIIDYTGDIINLANLNARYDLDANTQFTAPYAAEIIAANSFVDSACNRGIGSLANHIRRSHSNAKFVKTRNAQGAYTGVKLVATRDILNNNEILVSYGANYRFNEPTSHRTTYRRN